MALRTDTRDTRHSPTAVAEFCIGICLQVRSTVSCRCFFDIPLSLLHTLVMPDSHAITTSCPPISVSRHRSCRCFFDISLSLLHMLVMPDLHAITIFRPPISVARHYLLRESHHSTYHFHVPILQAGITDWSRSTVVASPSTPSPRIGQPCSQGVSTTIPWL